ncbi:sulfite exporter TauE/SafE family protein [Halopseudomonas xiamenensis]|uniref:sulfite exporter TauE/SafE family protein n=1 Tax=Halopseudomonas xiamenensis TaxID=157792 RepID=UPI001627967E|nr:sulfite exporter TauE/SafE family protein [Halopseudomonas xiamenensis]
MITDPLFYLCAIPAVLLYGIAKGGFGGNIAILSVPLMSLVMPPQQAATILLPILCTMDLVALRTFRGRWSKPNLRIIVPAALVGTLLAWLSFSWMSDAHIQLMIGVIAVAFTLNIWLRRGEPPVRGVSVWRGGFWGMVAGFTSFGIHAGGPPINVYLLPQKLDKTLLMGTIAVFFAVVNLAKVPAYIQLGQFDSGNLLTALVLLPLAPIGIRLGFWMLQRTNQELIYQLCYIFLFITGCKLLYDGGMALFG